MVHLSAADAIAIRMQRRVRPARAPLRAKRASRGVFGSFSEVGAPRARATCSSPVCSEIMSSAAADIAQAAARPAIGALRHTRSAPSGHLSPFPRLPFAFAMGKKDKRERGGGVARRELPQAAPVDDSDLEPDEDDIAFVAKHRTYGAFFGDRLSVDAISTGSNKKRKKAIADEDKTQSFERGSRVAGAWEGGDGADDDDGLQPLALPVKRLDGTVVRPRSTPRPSRATTSTSTTSPPPRAPPSRRPARRGTEPARTTPATPTSPAPRKKALKADERANAIGADPKRRDKTSEKWWDAKKEDEDEDEDDEDEDNASSDSDSDPAVRARRARASAAAALEAEMSAADRSNPSRTRGSGVPRRARGPRGSMDGPARGCEAGGGSG